MSKVLIGAALLAGVVAGSAGMAIAQMPPQGRNDDRPAADRPGERPGPDGMRGWDRGFRRMHGMMERSRGAVFALRRGDNHLFIKCSDEESTRACVDAASALLDKVGSGAATTPTPTPTPTPR
jgi:hypothetical protein